MEKSIIKINGAIFEKGHLELIAEMQSNDNHDILKLTKTINDIIHEIYLLQFAAENPQEYKNSLNKSEIIEKLMVVNWHLNLLMCP